MKCRDYVPSAPPSDCVYEQRAYRHTERFYHPSDNCRLCACTNGTVHCQRRPCPFASCSHPITRECCRSCEGAMRIYLFWYENASHLHIYCSVCVSPACNRIVQAVITRAGNELMVRHGTMCQTHVLYVFAVRVLFGVQKRAVHPPTVTTQSGDSAACPVTVSEALSQLLNIRCWHQRSHLSSASLQAACFMVTNILTAVSFVMTRTPVVCVTVMVERSAAAKSLAMENAAILTNHLDNVVENVNVCSIEIKSKLN